MNKMNKKGFTLIEMLVVIAIIAVLVAIIIPTVSNSTMKAKGAADAANLRSIAAEAGIEYLQENNLIKKSYTLKSKVTGTDLAVKFYTDANGSLIPVVAVNESTNASIEYFAYIAENGKSENAPVAPGGLTLVGDGKPTV